MTPLENRSRYIVEVFVAVMAMIPLPTRSPVIHPALLDSLPSTMRTSHSFRPSLRAQHLITTFFRYQCLNVQHLFLALLKEGGGGSPTVGIFALRAKLRKTHYEPNFYKEIKLQELASAFYSENEQKLLDLIEYIVFEVRPLAMQANEEEISWLVLTCLILENLEPITKYSQRWTYEDVRLATFSAQNNGLRQNLNNKTLGQIGLDLLKLIGKNSFQEYEQYLSKLHSRFRNHCSLADDAIRILDNDRIEALLDNLTICRSSYS